MSPAGNTAFHQCATPVFGFFSFVSRSRGRSVCIFAHFDRDGLRIAIEKTA
ncbi:hypothetical protein SUBVAR_06461 [Subdoligranulum variabile DSM 15176]|uniref:Uncharacterized protein n=1 Tax=Subdoligranulum variabile DSM 15176 TaxID=411471 RepID=D1PPZ4_9FIRM|nr:hypothetical protein SUBVAR_06461 [Subdoligranulum variabile DSM 15176]